MFIFLILIGLNQLCYSDFNWMATIIGPNIYVNDENEQKEKKDTRRDVVRKNYRFKTIEGDFVLIEFLYIDGKQDFKRPSNIEFESPKDEFKNKIGFALKAFRHIQADGVKIKIYLKYETYISQRTKKMVYKKVSHGIVPDYKPSKHGESVKFELISEEGVKFEGHYRALKKRGEK